MEDKEFIQSVRNIPYFKLGVLDKERIVKIITSYNLSLEQTNKIYLSFLFGDTIEIAFKKVVT